MKHFGEGMKCKRWSYFSVLIDIDGTGIYMTCNPTLPPSCRTEAMANSVDPDQSRSSLICVCTVCQELSV